MFRTPRQATTSLDCPRCRAKLEIRRTCHEAYLHCPSCPGDFALKDFARDMDAVMENFLEQIYSDRI